MTLQYTAPCTDVARELGISRVTLYKVLKRLGIDPKQGGLTRPQVVQIRDELEKRGRK